MDERVLTAALVVVAVLALGATAASVDSVDPSTDGRAADTPTPRDRPTPGGQSGGGLGCPDPLSSGPGLLAAIAAVVVVSGASYRVTRSALPALVLGPPAFLWLITACGGALPAIGPLFSPLGGVFGVVFGAPLALLALVVFAVAGALALLFVDADVSFFRDEAFVPPEETETADLAAVGDAAGAAAERIENDADVSNEVYRAWVEMTRHLAVAHPDATTADEFADAAVAAGMAVEDVETLTRLFQDVRYGGADPETRADEAVETLRRIERTYGSGEP